MICSKRKHGWIIGTSVIVLLLIPFIYLGVSYYIDETLKYKKIEGYYHADTESFNEIVRYFDNLYKENLYEVKFNCNNTYLEFKVKEMDDTDEINYTTKNVDCTNASFVKELSKLQEKYQKNCDYSVFSNVYAYYDKAGNMLLYMQAYNRKISMEEKRCYYLVYIEEEYNGNDSSLGIDDLDVYREPFTDNWYTWAMDWLFG